MDRTQLQTAGIEPQRRDQDLLVSTAGTTQTSPGLLAESRERRGLQLDRAVAAVCGRQPGCAAAHAGARGGGRDGHAPQLLSNLVGVAPAAQQAVDSRYNLAPAIDIYVSVQGRDLGSISVEIRQVGGRTCGRTCRAA